MSLDQGNQKAASQARTLTDSGKRLDECRCENARVFRSRQDSVVVRAAEIVAAVSTHQLAAVAHEAVGTRRADLAMMLNRSLAIDGALRTTLWDFRRKFGVQN